MVTVEADGTIVFDEAEADGSLFSEDRTMDDVSSMEMDFSQTSGKNTPSHECDDVENVDGEQIAISQSQDCKGEVLKEGFIQENDSLSISETSGTLFLEKREGTFLRKIEDEGKIKSEDCIQNTVHEITDSQTPSAFPMTSNITESLKEEENKGEQLLVKLEEEGNDILDTPCMKLDLGIEERLADNVISDHDESCNSIFVEIKHNSTKEIGCEDDVKKENNAERSNKKTSALTSIHSLKDDESDSEANSIAHSNEDITDPSNDIGDFDIVSNVSERGLCESIEVDQSSTPELKSSSNLSEKCIGDNEGDDVEEVEEEEEGMEEDVEEVEDEEVEEDETLKVKDETNFEDERISEDEDNQAVEEEVSDTASIDCENSLSKVYAEGSDLSSTSAPQIDSDWDGVDSSTEKLLEDLEAQAEGLSQSAVMEGIAESGVSLITMEQSLETNLEQCSPLKISSNSSPSSFLPSSNFAAGQSVNNVPSSNSLPIPTRSDKTFDGSKSSSQEKEKQLQTSVIPFDQSTEVSKDHVKLELEG